ncbi:MAG: PhoH family protein [Flavobacteriales bacterium]|nr:PhoH family protein [Flavobacteriales bacterium]MBK6752362.1 PhoH family protein [Flavobacteriales bacterium]MBK7268874.1 PhoH family protein [Flavobacteriales bacterium]MBK9074334.1 PhoH family protein [Flavobacteriales bacterium]MBK9537869.1 PhoH family protein [Flavobacteriales bacterium]
MKKKDRKIFVLDTSVILYDHSAIECFQEHDVAIPIQVLEELDTFKKGNDTINFEAREFIRHLDGVAQRDLLTDWIPLNGPTKGKFKVVAKHDLNGVDATKVFADGKNDHQILNAALTLQRQNKDRKVVLVTKDIALRLKAKSLNIIAEDYLTGRVKDVQDNLYTGRTVVDDLNESLIDQLFERGSMPVEDLGIGRPTGNHFFILKHKKKSILAKFDPRTAQVDRVEKHSVFGIGPKNAEQALAMSAMMDPEIKLVTLQGAAGTGKTLLALACALEQRRLYRQIYVTRPVVPLSNKDIGYLPGDIQSKLDPYMQPLWDNLKLIKGQFEKHDNTPKRIDEMLENEKIAIAPLAYIRGRSLSNIFFIVDEAQNLTPLEVKTVISRAGEGTKIVFTGDVHQIDSPFLDSESNGLSYLIDKAKGDPIFAHITLEKGERSALANLANDLL